MTSRHQERVLVNGRQDHHDSTTWPSPDAAPNSLLLNGRNSGGVASFCDGFLGERAPHHTGDATRPSYPDPYWTSGVTTFRPDGVPDRVPRVTTFATDPTDRDRRFAGRGVLVLYASTDQTDMDVMVRVLIVPGRPDAGPPDTVSHGWLRASHRAEDPALSTDMRPFLRHNRTEPLTPGEVYLLRIALMPMSFLVRRGERIWLEISDDDSLLTGAPMTHRSGQRVGTDTYHHDRDHASHLRLPERPPTVGPPP